MITIEMMFGAFVLLLVLGCFRSYRIGRVKLIRELVDHDIVGVDVKDSGHVHLLPGKSRVPIILE